MYVTISLSIFCLSFTTLHTVSEATKPHASKKYVVVFDLDSTLCKSDVSREEFEIAEEHYPECPMITWTCKSHKNNTREIKHIFLPYLQLLFDYLLDKGVRIAFFSGATKERNQFVIAELLTSFWGSDKFKALKAKGQFDIFSEEHLRRGDQTLDKNEGALVKDLSPVFRDGESLSDVVLVEDDPSYVPHDQEPCMFIFDLLFCHLDGKLDNDYPLNNIYYMLGVFTTYFEDEKYAKLPLREGLKQIQPKDYLRVNSLYANKTIEKGLLYVRKQFLNARLYKVKIFYPE